MIHAKMDEWHLVSIHASLAGGDAPFPVYLLPNQSKTADTVKQTAHSDRIIILSSQPQQHPTPGRYGYAIAQSPIPGGIAAFLVQLVLTVTPGANICPAVRITLQPFAFQRR